MLILGCAMLMAAQVPVPANAEEITNAEGDESAALLSATDLKWADKKLSFVNPNEGRVNFEFRIMRDGEVLTPANAFLNGMEMFQKGTVVSNDYSKYFTESGTYTFQVRACWGHDKSEWSSVSEPYAYEQAAVVLPAPVVVAGTDGTVKASLPDGSYVLGVDYQFVYTLYVELDSGPFQLESVESSESTYLFNIEKMTHLVSVKAKSLKPEIGDSGRVGPVPFDGKVYGTASEDSGSSDSEAGASNGSHQHDYEWVPVSEATATENALEAYTCKNCGSVKEYMEVSNSAYAKFNKDAISAIDKAPVNGTVTLNTDRWVSFYASVIDMLKSRPDVNVVVNYFYKGTRYTMTIPAGADLSVLVESEGYYGFRYLDLFFPGQEVK